MTIEVILTVSEKNKCSVTLDVICQSVLSLEKHSRKLPGEYRFIPPHLSD